MGIHSRITDRDDWLDLFIADKQSILDTMVSNMTADLDNGYNYFGQSIMNQREMIDEYKKQFDAELDSFKSMDEKAVNCWCYYDLIKRGAIA